MALIIRAMTEADLAGTTALRNLPGVRWGTLSTPFESVERWRKIRATAPAVEITHLVACDAGIVVGHAVLHRNPAPRRAHIASIGINVHDDWTGRGVGSALFEALIDLADNWLGLQRLELGVYTDNAAAIALYRKFGFEVEGTERAEAFRDGAFVDAYVMARLRGPLAPSLGAAPAPTAPAPEGAYILRSAEPDDLENISEIMNQPTVRHETLRLPFSTAEDNRQFAAPEDRYTKSIAAVVGERVVGVGVLVPGAGRRAHTGDISILAVHDAYRRRGIGTGILSALLEAADNWLNLRRVTLSVFADNAFAIPMFTKLGFVQESYRRADAFRAGGFVDSVAMGRIRV